MINQACWLGDLLADDKNSRFSTHASRALSPELYHHTPFSSSSYDTYTQQRYWSHSSFMH